MILDNGLWDPIYVEIWVPIHPIPGVHKSWVSKIPVKWQKYEPLLPILHIRQSTQLIPVGKQYSYALGPTAPRIHLCPACEWENWIRRGLVSNDCVLRMDTTHQFLKYLNKCFHYLVGNKSNSRENCLIGRGAWTVISTNQRRMLFSQVWPLACIPVLKEP